MQCSPDQIRQLSLVANSQAIVFSFHNISLDKFLTDNNLLDTKVLSAYMSRKEKKCQII